MVKTEHLDFNKIENDFFFLNKLAKKDVGVFVNRDKYTDEFKGYLLKKDKEFKDKTYN